MKLENLRLGDRRGTRSLAPIFVLSVGLFAATAALVVLGYRATGQWVESARLLVERRAENALTLLTTALARDMEGAQELILRPIQSETLTQSATYELTRRVAQAFARFPYPESFFAWTAGAGTAEELTFFNRTDRPPPWGEVAAMTNPFPVTVVDDPVRGREFALFEMDLDGTPYQVVAHLLYETPVQDRLSGLVGFAVNLDWVEANYFPEMLSQVARIADVSDDLILAVYGPEGTIAATGPTTESPLQTREFPMVFFDRVFLVQASADLGVRYLDAGISTTTQSRAVDTLVVRLRKKIEVDPRQPKYLQTAYGDGYRLVVE